MCHHHLVITFSTASLFRIYLESWRTFDFVQTFSLFSFPSPPCVFFLSLPLFSLSPVFCPNWRLKREFYILAASDDERPLITVYPCRWCTAVATWDTSISFYVFLLFLFFMCPSSLSSQSLLYIVSVPNKTWNQKYIRLWYDKHLLWSVVCEAGCK